MMKKLRDFNGRLEKLVKKMGGEFLRWDSGVYDYTDNDKIEQIKINFKFRFDIRKHLIPTQQLKPISTHPYGNTLEVLAVFNKSIHVLVEKMSGDFGRFSSDITEYPDSCGVVQIGISAKGHFSIKEPSGKKKPKNKK